MNEYRIIGKKMPNRIVLSSGEQNSKTELPLRRVRRMFESGIINIANPESLYVKI